MVRHCDMYLWQASIKRQHVYCILLNMVICTGRSSTNFVGHKVTLCCSSTAGHVFFDYLCRWVFHVRVSVNKGPNEETDPDKF